MKNVRLESVSVDQQKNSLVLNYSEHLINSSVVSFNANETLRFIKNRIKIILNHSGLGLKKFFDLREQYPLIKCVDIMKSIYEVGLKRMDPSHEIIH